MKIGEAVASIEFSDAEKDRIGEALRDSHGLPYQVIVQQVAEIHDPDFWRPHQKAFNVQGFRWGAPPARQLVLKKALESIRGHVGHEVRSIWRFYRSGIVHFVVHDLAALNDLLLSEELLDDERPLTDRIFASIRRAMPLYDVPEEPVRQFYLLWGFERTTAFESILRDDAITVSIAKRLLAKEAKALTGLLTDRMNAIGEELRIDSDSDMAADLGELRGRVEKLASAVTTTAAVEQRLTEVTATVRALETRLVPGSPAIANSSASRESPRSTLDDKTANSLRERVESLAATVSRHEKRLQQLSPFKSAPPAAGSTAKHADENWNDFLARVRASCRKAGFELKYATTARILVELIRRGRVICCQASDLWLSVLAAREAPEIRWESASPLWVEAQDWRDSIAFISDYSASARVLVLMDFDVGLQEAYLLPTLRTWIASTPRQCEHRLVLVPSDPSFEGVSPRVLEACVANTSASEFIAEVERIARGADADLSARWRQTTPSRPFTFEETSSSELELQVRKLFENLGTTMPPTLARQFISVMHGIGDFIGDSAAARIASECTLLPWYRRARGEGASRVLGETLRSIYGAA